MSSKTLDACAIRENWPSSWGTTDCKLVLALDRDIVSEDGAQFEGANNPGSSSLSNLGFHFSSTITVTDGRGNAAAIAGLPCTDLATPASKAHYYAYIYVKGVLKARLNEGKAMRLHSNELSSTFTWQSWVIVNEVKRRVYPNPFVADTVTVAQMIAAALSLGQHASDLIEGKLYLDVPPLVASHPVAVGVNSPLLTALAGVSLRTPNTQVKRDADAAFDNAKIRLIDFSSRTQADDHFNSPLGFGEGTRLHIGEGVTGVAASTIKPAVHIERYFNPNLTAPYTGFNNLFAAWRTGGGNAYSVENIASFYYSDSTYNGFNGAHDQTGIASHTWALAGSFARPYGLYSDTRLFHLNSWGTSCELDIGNETGALAPIMSSGSPASGTLICLQLTPVIYETALSRECSTAIFIQATPHPVSGWNRFRQGMFFAPNSISERGIDMSQVDLPYASSPGYVSPFIIRPDNYITALVGGLLYPIIGMNPSRVVFIGEAGAKVTLPGVFVNASSRTLKTNFIEPVGVLDKLALLPVRSYNYFVEDTPHIGPVAEDFHEVFGFGDDESIAPSDLAGVALAAIKELYSRVTALEAR